MSFRNTPISSNEWLISLKEKIKISIANQIHEWWRRIRLYDNTQDTFRNRWKLPQDASFEKHWSKILWNWEQLSISKWNDWKIYIDIANTHSNQLPIYWKNANKEVCEFSMDIIINNLKSFDEINNDLLDTISEKIHDFWRLKNPSFFFKKENPKKVSLSEWWVICSPLIILFLKFSNFL